MGNDENIVYPTRSSSKKRASSAHSLQPSNKRVALGELTNSLNVSNSIEGMSLSCRKNDLKCEVEEHDSLMTKSTRETDGENREVKEYSPSQNSELTRFPCSSSMYRYLRSMEVEEKRRCSPDYMKKVQRDIAVNMREILVDWLVEVAEEYKLFPDTLYLSVLYIDRFLSSQAWSRNKLQLLGVTCLLIASKNEEISPPHVEDCCYVTDNTYTKEEIMNMEKDVLRCLDYEMRAPTTRTFLRIFVKAAQRNCESSDPKFECLCCFLADLSLLEYGCLCFLPSVIAASAVFLARLTIKPELHPWTKELQCYSGYKPSELKQCVLTLHDLQLNRRGSSLQAVREKYKQQKFHFIAKLPPPPEVPLHYF